MQTPAERLNEVLQAVSLNIKALSEALGYERPQSLYDVAKGRTKSISNDLANRIIKTYPNFSKSWLLTGEGPKYAQVQEGGGVNIQESRLDNSTVNGGGFITALLKELDAQRAITQKCLAQIDKSQAQIDRLITLLEAERGRK